MALSKAPEKQSKRLGSIDFLRGLTIFLMIFADCGFLDSPWFMRHFYPYDAFSGATYVDFIFPTFLLLMGLSIPLSCERYGDAVEDRLRLLKHFAIRGCAMLGIGVLILNRPDCQRTGGFGWLQPCWEALGVEPVAGGEAMWRLLVMCGVILLLFQADRDRLPRWLEWSLRSVGALLLAVYLVLFRNAAGGWLGTGWWEIIGLLGWAYMTTGILYLCLRRSPELLFMGVMLLIALTLVGRAGHLRELPVLQYLYPFVGGHAILSTLGAAMGAMLLKRRGDHQAMLTALVQIFLLTGLCAVLLTPVAGLQRDPKQFALLKGYPDYIFLFGFSKEQGTLGWMFMACSLLSLLCIPCYYLFDVRHGDFVVLRWLRELGSVPLTAYLFQFLFFALFAVTGLDVLRMNGEWMNMWTSGLLTFLLTLLICGAAVLCKRHGFRLKL